MGMASRDEIKSLAFAAGVSAAQAEARRVGFRWGDVVAHPSFGRTCELRGIVGGTAYLLDPEEGMIEVAAEGLFDPNVALRAAVAAALLSAICSN